MCYGQLLRMVCMQELSTCIIVIINVVTLAGGLAQDHHNVVVTIVKI